MKIFARFIYLIFILLIATQLQVHAMIMPYPYSISELAADASLLIKAKVLSTEPASAPKNHPLSSPYWRIRKAKLQIISLLKGKAQSSEIEMLYRSDIPLSDKALVSFDASAENHAHFKLEVNKCYLLFLRQNKNEKSYIQTSTNFTMRSWEGFYRAGDCLPLNKEIKPDKAIFIELINQLKSHDPATAQYAAKTLLKLSRDKNLLTSDGTNDFSRKSVLEGIFANKDELPKSLSSKEFLKPFLTEIGSYSPYSRDDFRTRFLWSKSTGSTHSWSEWPQIDNSSLEPALPYLIKTASSNQPGEIRSMAILSLGLCQNNLNMSKTISSKIESWLSDKDDDVRAAACALSADYPSIVSANKQVKFLQDPSAKVRSMAALSIGFAQTYSLIPQLEKMLGDHDAKVKAHSALSLMSMPVDKTKHVLLTNLSNKEFGTGFLCRLASKDPLLVQKQLVSECSKKWTHEMGIPANDAQIIFQNGIGADPHYRVRIIVRDYLRSIPIETRNTKPYSELVACLKEQPEFQI